MAMISAKRRDTEVFSMAFLDCICCGFGAVLLIYILTIAQQKSRDTESIDAVKERRAQRAAQVQATEDQATSLAQMLAAAQTAPEQRKTKRSGRQVNLTSRQK